MKCPELCIYMELSIDIGCFFLSVQFVKSAEVACQFDFIGFQMRRITVILGRNGKVLQTYCFSVLFTCKMPFKHSITIVIHLHFLSKCFIHKLCPKFPEMFVILLSYKYIFRLLGYHVLFVCIFINFWYFK